MYDFLDFFPQNLKVPYRHILTSLPVISLCLCHFARNWVIILLLTNEPYYLSMFGFSVAEVRSLIFINLCNFFVKGVGVKNYCRNHFCRINKYGCCQNYFLCLNFIWTVSIGTVPDSYFSIYSILHFTYV